MKEAKLEPQTFKRCEWCPVSCGKPCISELSKAKSLCNKLDPANPDHNPNYAVAIINQSCSPEKYVAVITSGVAPYIQNSSGTYPFRAEDVQQARQDKDPKFPSLWEQTKNLGKAIIDYTKSGFENVPTEVYNERISTCESCEHFKDNSRCDICNCFMRVKCHMANVACPIAKWDKYSPEQSPKEDTKAPVGGCGCNK